MIFFMIDCLINEMFLLIIRQNTFYRIARQRKLNFKIVSNEVSSALIGVLLDCQLNLVI